MKSKLYLAFICGQNDHKNIQELTEVYDHFDGLAAVYHNNDVDVLGEGVAVTTDYNEKCLELLHARKKSGFVITRPFYQHHAHSMNDFLLNPQLEVGSWILLRDTCERVNPAFAGHLPEFIRQLENNNINTVYQYSKALLFRKFEHQIFMGSPHWGLREPQPNMLAMERIPQFANERDYCYSIRNDIRPPDHFIDHFVKYYLYDSSNHLLLGRENDQEAFQKHESMRQQFKQYWRDVIQQPLTVMAIKRYIMAHTLDQDVQLKAYFNTEVILNAFYRYYVLKHDVEILRKDINDKITIDL